MAISSKQLRIVNCSSPLETSQEVSPYDETALFAPYFMFRSPFLWAKQFNG
jgi:hypothetical protein